MYWIWSENFPDLSHLGPIWPTLGPILVTVLPVTSLEWQMSIEMSNQVRVNAVTIETKCYIQSRSTIFAVLSKYWLWNMCKHIKRIWNVTIDLWNPWARLRKKRILSCLSAIICYKYMAIFVLDCQLTNSDSLGGHFSKILKTNCRMTSLFNGRILVFKISDKL